MEKSEIEAICKVLRVHYPPTDEQLVELRTILRKIYLRGASQGESDQRSRHANRNNDMGM